LGRPCGCMKFCCGGGVFLSFFGAGFCCKAELLMPNAMTAANVTNWRDNFMELQLVRAAGRVRAIMRGSNVIEQVEFIYSFLALIESA
jgi:hypothetical protein